jgi:putative oxidoreductase
MLRARQSPPRVSASLKRLLLAGPETGRWADSALVARVVSGSVFVGFGVGKFVDHAAEVSAFERYGLPSPDAFVYAIGLLELGGGLLLLAGLVTRAAALLLAGNMVGAITVSGIAEGEIISLTLAPTLLALMVLLIVVGPGHHALDRRLASA